LILVNIDNFLKTVNSFPLNEIQEIEIVSTKYKDDIYLGFIVKRGAYYITIPKETKNPSKYWIRIKLDKVWKRIFKALSNADNPIHIELKRNNLNIYEDNMKHKLVLKMETTNPDETMHIYGEQIPYEIIEEDDSLLVKIREGKNKATLRVTNSFIRDLIETAKNIDVLIAKERSELADTNLVKLSLILDFTDSYYIIYFKLFSDW